IGEGYHRSFHERNFDIQSSVNANCAVQVDFKESDIFMVGKYTDGAQTTSGICDIIGQVQTEIGRLRPLILRQEDAKDDLDRVEHEPHLFVIDFHLRWEWRARGLKQRNQWPRFCL